MTSSLKQDLQVMVLMGVPYVETLRQAIRMCDAMEIAEEVLHGVLLDSHDAEDVGTALQKIRELIR